MDFSDPVALAAALLRCPSITPDHNVGPDGGAMALVQSWVEALGFTVLRFDRGRTPNLYARRGRTGSNFCFAGHTDVVPVGEGWTRDPFAAEIADGRLYGRGAVDMKGAIACFIAAVSRTDSSSVSLLITGDEEGTARDGTVHALAELEGLGERLDLCLVGEPTSGTALGDVIKTGRRGSLNGLLRVTGTQGHVAYPDAAANPIPALARMAAALGEAAIDGEYGIFPPSHLEVTGLLSGTGATNMIPGTAEARFNIRYNPLQDAASLEDWLRSRLNGLGEYELTLADAAQPFMTAPGSFTRSVAQAVRSVTGREAAFEAGGGTSDARFIGKACPQTLELGLCNGMAHKADEYVPLEDLRRLTEIYSAILDSL